MISGLVRLCYRIRAAQLSLYSQYILKQVLNDRLYQCILSNTEYDIFNIVY